jgi:predicted ArsR family transcriptional regulator
MSNYSPDNGTATSQPGGVQSVDRAISVLEILAQRGEAGVSEVAAEIEVHKSTAFRLLGALETRGLADGRTWQVPPRIRHRPSGRRGHWTHRHHPAEP